MNGDFGDDVDRREESNRFVVADKIEEVRDASVQNERDFETSSTSRKKSPATHQASVYLS